MSLPVKAALLATRDLRGTDRLVVLAIAAHTNAAGDAWPAVATIAEYVGVSERTVQRALARLVQAGRLAVRQVTGIVTRVYRLVAQGVTSAIKGVSSGAPGVPDQPAGGDSQNGTVSPEVDGGEKGKRAGARDWRRWIPKSKSTTGSRPPWPERRGAALPPPPGGDRCRRPGHGGQIVGRCAPCRSEAVGVR
ncbi:helix-turn-helix domain-containing protein [Micromonospora matsumotoense]|uniref:helix-turn-helix domain-containing protein n=1 Tax=Micromonospora matsumotoense TaxID=121616 RepID=UPI003446E925